MTDRGTPAASGNPLQQNLDTTDRQVYAYPPFSTLQHPPPARISSAKRLSEGQATDKTRVQSSVSSASGSSSFSYRKHQTLTPDSQWPSPTCERTLVNSDQRSDKQHSPQWHAPGSARVSHSHKRSEMTERQSRQSPPVSRIHERRQIEQEHDEDDDEEDDHAIWILVRISTL